jgi:hypothetical protein
MHLGRFRQAYTEMTGMMAGMTMGMMNGFVLGYAAGAATNNMFWGNLFGVLLGLALGVYFGRAGGLMGMLDGGMGGVMGGSMGAMLALMIVFPPWGLYVTALLLGIIYLASMLGLVVLIERSAPEHAALHRLMPMFTRAMAIEAAEEAERAGSRSAETTLGQITDYYALLGVQQEADSDTIANAYLARLAEADQQGVEQLERAMATLTEPYRREAYDRRLRESQADCCPPPRKKARPTETATLAANASNGISSTTSTAVSVATLAPSTQQRDSTVLMKSQASRPSNVKQGVPARSSKGSAARPESQKQKEPPISAVGIVVGLLLVGGLLGWWAMNGFGNGVSGGASSSVPLPPGYSQEMEAQAVVAPIGPDGRQTLDFVVSGHTLSYEPKVIKVKQGVPVHFNVRVEGPDPG